MVLKPIALIGLRGSGKSSLASRLSEKLCRPWRDMDHLLVERAGLSIPDWVARDGWGPFREAEEKLLVELIGDATLILATGGGVVTRKKSVELLRRDTVAIYLHWPWEELVNRIQGDVNRPSLKPGVELKDEMHQLYAERDALYRRAATHVLEGIVGEKLQATLQKLTDALKENQEVPDG